ncbi:mediator complex subunit MED14-domain-containing protein [Infundibulicybe gibba]|nr:mediator complex subunit MED14-domain-containing protein [Infundibulicybe gibba]
MAVQLAPQPARPGSPPTQPNGILETPIGELERELPMVYDGQIPLGDLLSRVMQSIYAELSELAETMPNMSDAARKRILADWVVKTKKQVAKLYAVVKWARDADTVQKCMNQQFEDSIHGLNYGKESLDPARLRNHDLLTSLDVLTTGSYLRLPTCIKKTILPTLPMTDLEVKSTLLNIEDIIRYRLQMKEVIPIEMSQHRIGIQIRRPCFFTAPNLFETSICLQGGRPDDGWFCVDVEFLITIGGDLTGVQDFPRKPTGIVKQYVTNEADARLAMYLPLPPLQGPPEIQPPPKPQLPDGFIDTPLVRLFNFLQMMSLSYQLEVLWYQAERMRSLGWGEFLSVRMGPDRKSMVVAYWTQVIHFTSVRPPSLPTQGRPRTKLPALGGAITISIIESRGPSQTGAGSAKSPKARIMANIQRKSKLGNSRPSDDVEGLEFRVSWEPAQGALGVDLPSESSTMPDGHLFVDANSLDFEALLRRVIRYHTSAILRVFQYQFQRTNRSVFSSPESSQALHVRLCADEVVIVTIDSRTGRLNLRDTGDLAAAGRGPRFAAISDKLNEDPAVLLRALFQLRINTITDLAEQKASYLGLQSFRRRNFLSDELAKLGPTNRGTLFIQLSSFPNHYLVLVITDERFRYALITTKILSETMYANMIMEDIAWLDFDRIHGDDITISTRSDNATAQIGIKRKRNHINMPNVDLRLCFAYFLLQICCNSFNVETQVLRELYSYCCARVAYMNVERQLKLRGIPFIHVNPTSGIVTTPELAHLKSSLARSVPALCVQSKHILSGAPAAEAAMPNIRVIPLNWWSEKSAQVVTCVKLKYVQQPMGKKAAGTSSIIRPSKRIIYDTTEAVVSFLSENVNTCVDEFLEEWARVSKMVVIAREVAQMAKKKEWEDIRLLSFDLQTVEFVYALNYTISITCEDQLSPAGGNFDLRFSRCPPSPMSDHHKSDTFNPHDDAEPFLRNVLRHGHGRLAPSMHRLVTLLRDTLSIAVELEAIRRQSDQDGCSSAISVKLTNPRHALDFRLMGDKRIIILDGSYSLFDFKASNMDSPDELGLLPIPHFQDIITSTIQELDPPTRTSLGKIALVDVGLICESQAVGMLGRALYTKMLAIIKVTGSNVS